MMNDLNEQEQLVLTAIEQNSLDATGGDFAFSDELHHYLDIGRDQISGYVSQLEQKGYIDVYDSVAPNTNQIEIID